MAELTTAERLCEKLNRLDGGQRLELELAMRDIVWCDTAQDVEAAMILAKSILDGDKQEGGEHG